MRKLFSILLLIAFTLPFAGPLLASGTADEAGLPACCRRNGEHHCAMTMAERTQQDGQLLANQDASKQARFRAPLERCPYGPQMSASFHSDLAGLAPAKLLYAALASHPACHAQTECKWRMARDRSRQKRGPPSA